MHMSFHNDKARQLIKIGCFAARWDCMSPGEGLSEYAGRGSGGPRRGQLGAKQGPKVEMAAGQAGREGGFFSQCRESGYVPLCSVSGII